MSASEDASVSRSETEGRTDASALTPDLEAEKPKRQLSPRAKGILLVIAIVLAVLLLVLFIHHETTGKYQQETNDAQIEADAVTVAPRVNGYVTAVLVENNQDVKAGQVLARIDPRTYATQAAQAEASIAQALAGADNARAGIQEQYAAIDQSRAQLVNARAKASYDADQVTRYAPLAAAGAETREHLAQLRSAAAQSAAAAAAQAAALEAQQRRIGTMQAQVRQAQAQAQGARAQLAAANVDVSATDLKAVIDGRIGDKSVTLGQFAQAGTRLMSIVPLDKLYVVANFKETQLALMRTGQPATIKVDALGGTVIEGRVESVSPGTGARFSLIPPSNATGNFTKIVQRVPVRIAIRASDAARRLLVPGLSVTVSVDTLSAKGDLGRIKDEQKLARQGG
jgi:membrane fusion protein (multidrug efflux system)